MIVQCYALTTTKYLVGVSDSQMVCTKQDQIISGGNRYSAFSTTRPDPNPHKWSSKQMP